MRFSLWRFRKLNTAVICTAVMLSGCGQANPGKPASKPAVRPKQVSKPVAATKPAAPAKPAADQKPKLSLVQKGVTLQWVDNGELRMTATAAEFRGNEVTRQGVLTDFSAKLYENGKPATIMNAPRVVADTVGRVLTATGGVTIKSLSRKTVVKSGWAKWYQKQQKVVGNGGVKINSEAWTAESAAFVADTGLKTVSLRSSAKGL
jgi:hypothetical protein